MTKNIITYSIVVPLFNEELVIKETYKRLKDIMDSTKETYEILLVNDGSRDKTAQIAKDICRMDKNIKLLSFSRNFGHQVAITAGMDFSVGKAVIVIDADLQDPPEVIPEMIKKWKEGYDVVYGQRIRRKGETLFKKISAKVFYRVLGSMTDIYMPLDTGDFRLIDRKVCEALKALPERNRYVRGLVSWLGFKQTGVEFIREQRFAGETKYSFEKMLKFACDGITSFSYKPLKLANYFGICASSFSLLYLALALFEKIVLNTALQAWSIFIAVSIFFNGLMFILLGIIGQYIGRIYDEAKGRPLYIIGEKEGFNCGKDSKA